MTSSRGSVAIRSALVVVFVLVLLVACKKTSVSSTSSSGADAGAASANKNFVPAPNSELARLLGADDAGRGTIRLYDDGPRCGNPPLVDRKKKGLSGQGPGSTPNRMLDFFETEGPPRDLPTLGTEKIEKWDEKAHLILSGPTRVTVGVEVKLTLTLVNEKRQPFRFATAMDGSFEHWRSPFVDLYARREAQPGTTYRLTYANGWGRCGNINPRTNEDFVVLAPGKRLQNPFGRHSEAVQAPTFDVPGRYTIWISYSLDCLLGAEYRQFGSREDVAIPPDVFDGTIVSNALVIDVVSAP